MKHETSSPSEWRIDLPTYADADIERLARETDMPINLVQDVYTSERAKMERSARIKTYVPILIHRHVKALLREQRTSL